MSIQQQWQSRSIGSPTETLEAAPIVTPTAPERHVFVRVRPRFDCRTALDQLEDIVYQHQMWNDPLSRRMFRWGAHVIGSVTASGRGDLEIKEALKQRIHVLAHEILFDRIGWVPLRAPLIVNEIVLDPDTRVQNIVVDRETWSDYCQAIRALYPGRAAPTQAPRSHDFAAKILSWMASLPEDLIQEVEVSAPSASEETESQSHLSLMAPPPPEALPWIKFMRLKACISNEQVRQEMEKCGRKMEAATGVIKELGELYLQSIHMGCELLRAELEANNAKIRDKLATIERVHQAEMSELHQKIDALRQQILVIQQRVAEVEEQAATHDRAIQDLQASREQMAQECASLRRQPRKRDQCFIS